MTAHERTAEDIRIMRTRVFSEQAGVCWYCRDPIGFDSFELAHRIPQRDWCIKLWGAAVIHHRLNVVGTHRGRCNSASQLNPDSLQAEQLAHDIQKELARQAKRAFPKRTV